MPLFAFRTHVVGLLGCTFLAVFFYLLRSTYAFQSLASKLWSSHHATFVWRPFYLEVACLADNDRAPLACMGRDLRTQDFDPVSAPRVSGNRETGVFLVLECWARGGGALEDGV